jgi:diguanylate cyclase (GGDEF)-like protein
MWKSGLDIEFIAFRFLQGPDYLRVLEVAPNLIGVKYGEPFVVNKGTKRIEVTISIGLSTLELKGEAVADALKRADTALYRAKHDGRNRVVATAA